MPENKKLKQKMEKLDLETIAGRLAFIVKDAGIADRKIKSTMAGICDISPQAIHRWYDGNTSSPSAENIATLARYYRADLMWLITGERTIEGNDLDCDLGAQLRLKKLLPDGMDTGTIKQIKITLSSVEICTSFE